MIYLFFIFKTILLLSFIQYSISQENPSDNELIFYNNSPHAVFVHIYPLSMVFNGNMSYDLKVRYTSPQSTFHYINGRNSSDYSILVPESGASFNHDNSPALSLNKGALGFGKYKFVLSCNHYNFFDTCFIEWDYGYSYFGSPWTADLEIIFEDYNNEPKVFFQWSGDTTYYDVTYVDKNITSWDQQYVNTSSGYIRRIRNKEYGNFYFDTSNSKAIFPLDSRLDCYPENQEFYETNFSGYLTLNLRIDKNISTRDTLIDSITNISISENVLLTLNSGKIFNMTTPLYPPGGYTHLIISSDSAKLLFRPDAEINVEYPNKITLDTGGFLILNQNSEVNIFPGAYFCNKGGKILGNGKVNFKGGLHQNLCFQLADYLIQDSVKFILDSNAVVSVPANTTLHIRGYTTSLILNPGSKLLFGENSSIICDEGGKVIANNATFTSIDSTKKWNGISLSDLSQDTIKNCTIKNAMYGISISDKYDAEDTGIPYSTEISGCSFVNQTNYVLNSGVYIAGSNNVLIMNNTLSSTSLQKGFTHGIYAEYCPDGDFNIIGNNIYNSGNGMTLISCSPFVAQNTLTGNEYSECGMFLDNSNGTFEYNVISDFYSAAADHIFPITPLPIC